MKRILTAIIFSLLALSAAAQTQRVVVKTPGRQQDDGSITKGQRIAEAYVTVQGGNTYESDTNGELRMGKPSTGKYRFSGVRKDGYELADADFLMRDHNYSAENTLYIVMTTPEQHLKERINAERKIRKTLEAQLRSKQAQLQAMLAEQKITEQNYLAQLRELYDEQQKQEQLVRSMAEEYASIDFDIVDEFNREVSFLIISGELDKADSLLNTRGRIEDDIAELNKRREYDRERRRELDQSEQYLALRSERLAEHFRNMHLLCHQREDYDSAAYYLERRATIDSLRAESWIEAADYVRGYVRDTLRALELYRVALAVSSESDARDSIANRLNLAINELETNH